uniref:Globin family profile domain-containing protein n=2 Tax=Parascaris TaxID=6254 RepID=A0A915AIK3_PARUN
MGNAKSSEQVSSKRNASLPRLALPDDRRTSTAASKKFTKRMSTSSQGSTGQSGRTVKPALPLAQRQIVKGCMDNAKDDIAERIYRRVIEKREDFRTFVESLPIEQRMELADNLREFLNGVVERLMDSEEVQRVSQEFGGRHVQFRSLGFRPDFFATTADAVTTECVFLDAAVHQASDTLTAWSTLTSLMFSSVRDGYYNEMRKQRRASNCLTKSKTTQEALPLDENNHNEEGVPRKGSRGGSRSVSPMESSEGVTDETVSGGEPPTETSEPPVLGDEAAEEESEANEKPESSNYLLPPQEIHGC